VRSAHGISVNAAFFAPLIGISPLSLFPPLIQMLSTPGALASRCGHATAVIERGRRQGRNPLDCFARLAMTKLSLFERALQGVLVLAGEVDDLGDLGLGDLVGEHSADGDALLVDLQHHSGRVLDAH